MTDAEIRQALLLLGIDETSYRALALLPLVQVAWADGKVQRAERNIILRVATENQYLEGPAVKLLEGWFAKRPKPEFFDRARELLVAMVKSKGNSYSAEMPIDTLTELVDVCEEIARAAGGFFGMFPMDVREQAAIKEIMDAIALPPTTSLDLKVWANLSD